MTDMLSNAGHVDGDAAVCEEARPDKVRLKLHVSRATTELALLTSLIPHPDVPVGSLAAVAIAAGHKTFATQRALEGPHAG